MGVYFIIDTEFKYKLYLELLSICVFLRATNGLIFMKFVSVITYVNVAFYSIKLLSVLYSSTKLLNRFWWNAEADYPRIVYDADVTNVLEPLQLRGGIAYLSYL